MANTPMEYKVRPFLRGLLWTILIVHLLIYVGLPLAFLAGATSDPKASYRYLLIIDNVLLPTFLFSVYFLYQNYGKTILTNDEVISKKFGFEKRIRYSDVIRVKEKDHHFPKNLVIKSKNKTIRISHNSCYFEEIYQVLANKIKAFHFSENVGFPWILRVRFFKLRKWLNIAGIIFVWGIPLGIVHSQLPASTTNGKLYTLGAFVLLWGLLSWLCIWMYLKEEWGNNKPHLYFFTQNYIDFQLPGCKIKSLPVENIEKINLVKFTKRGTAPGEGISVSFDAYAVIFNISGSRQLIIDSIRASQFGYSTLNIYQRLSKLYPALVDKNIKVQGNGTI